MRCRRVVELTKAAGPAVTGLNHQASAWPSYRRRGVAPKAVAPQSSAVQRLQVREAVRESVLALGTASVTRRQGCRTPKQTAREQQTACCSSTGETRCCCSALDAQCAAPLCAVSPSPCVLGIDPASRGSPVPHPTDDRAHDTLTRSSIQKSNIYTTAVRWFCLLELPLDARSLAARSWLA